MNRKKTLSAHVAKFTAYNLHPYCYGTCIMFVGKLATRKKSSETYISLFRALYDYFLVHLYLIAQDFPIHPGYVEYLPAFSGVRNVSTCPQWMKLNVRKRKIGKYRKAQSTFFYSKFGSTVELLKASDPWTHVLILPAVNGPGL